MTSITNNFCHSHIISFKRIQVLYYQKWEILRTYVWVIFSLLIADGRYLNKVPGQKLAAPLKFVFQHISYTSW